MLAGEYNLLADEYNLFADDHTVFDGEYNMLAGEYNSSAGEYNPSAGEYNPSAEHCVSAAGRDHSDSAALRRRRRHRCRPAVSGRQRGDPGAAAPLPHPRIAPPRPAARPGVRGARAPPNDARRLPAPRPAHLRESQGVEVRLSVILLAFC